MNEDDLTRQDEYVAATEFDREEASEPDFGNWPELLGVVLTVLLIWMSFAFRG